MAGRFGLSELSADSGLLPAEFSALPAEFSALPAEFSALPAEFSALPADSGALPAGPPPFTESGKRAEIKIKGRNPAHTNVWRCAEFMMNLWMSVLFLLFSAQTAQPQDGLTITRQGKTVAFVNRTDFASSIPGTPIIDSRKFNQFISKIDQQVRQNPVNQNT